MSPLLAPILAQLITLNVGDRTEARYVHSDTKYSEGSTRPFVGLTFGWQRGAIMLGYSPSFTLVPLETTPRNFLTFHAASLSGAYFWRRTTFTVSESAGYGELRFQAQALADPGINAVPTVPATGAVAPVPNPNPVPAPNTGNGGVAGGAVPGMNPQAANQIRVTDSISHYATSTTTVGVGHTLSRNATIAADASYSVGGQVGDSAKQYPMLSGARVGAYASYLVILNRQDSLTWALNAQYGVSSTGNRALGVLASGGLSHKFDARTTGRFGVGIGGSRLSTDDGTIAYSIYPTFTTGIVHFDRLAGGILTLGASAGASPYVDTLRATVDPRLTISLNGGWTRDRFSMGVSAGSAISLAGSDGPGAVNSVGATIGAAYRLGRGFSVDTGAGTAWQTFEGDTIIPRSWTTYVGITWTGQQVLNGKPH